MQKKHKKIAYYAWKVMLICIKCCIFAAVNS